jgi:hypothetical protein
MKAKTGRLCDGLPVYREKPGRLHCYPILTTPERLERKPMPRRTNARAPTPAAVVPDSGTGTTMLAEYELGLLTLPLARSWDRLTPLAIWNVKLMLEPADCAMLFRSAFAVVPGTYANCVTLAVKSVPDCGYEVKVPHVMVPVNVPAVPALMVKPDVPVTDPCCTGTLLP